jgi:hypothetical protein
VRINAIRACTARSPPCYAGHVSGDRGTEVQGERLLARIRALRQFHGELSAPSDRPRRRFDRDEDPRPVATSYLTTGGRASAGTAALKRVLAQLKSIPPHAEDAAIRHGLSTKVWQSLCLLGWSRSEIANVIGCSEKTM